MSLCFNEAYEARHRAANPISQQVYIQNLLEHLKGARHPQEDSKAIEDNLSAIEPWAASLRDWYLSASFNPVEDTSTYERLFTTCHEDDLEGFKTAFETVSMDLRLSVLQPATCLAAQTRSCSILDYCLSHHALFDAHLNKACTLGATTPEVLEVLFRYNWRSIRDKPHAQVFAFGEETFIGEWLKEKVRVMKEEKKSTNSGGNGKGKGRHGKQWNRKSEGRDPSKGTGSRDPRAGPDPEKIQKWFGDVPW